MPTFFKKKISKDQSKDTGMAMTLLCLILALSPRRHSVLYLAMALHIVNMIVPSIYGPIAIIWFGLSDLIGALMSKILLSIVFFGVVTPIGILRRLLGKDPLKLKAFKAGKESVMVERNYIFTSRDLERPY